MFLEGYVMVSLTEMGVIVGIVLGLFGSVFSVVQFFYGKKKDRLQFEREERKDRMEDMKLIFLDKDIPRKTREPFFEEFVRLGGNGLYARMWLEEGAKLGE
jgi:hypothetical protein